MSVPCPAGRRRTAVSLIAALAFAGAPALAPAQSPAAASPPAQLRTQVPGYYRMMFGQFEVTALYDGYVDLDTKVFKYSSPGEVQRLLARMFVATTPGMQTAVNAYLVHTGKNLVLVDTGTAACFGPTLGRVVENLRAAGYAPGQVDTVLLTHLHPDHACGLMADGKPVFANATVYVDKADAAYWLDEATAARAPQDAQPLFAMARAAVAPYQASGRLRTYAAGAELLPGVSAVPAHGHTPGHSGYLFRSADHGMLFWGDLVHSHAVQFRRPEVAMEFDVDSRQAVTTRKALFAQAARGQLWVAGAHLPFPGIGHVRAEGKGYAWVPVEYGPLRTDR
ncbi:MBL fold metallo-hydrolase [Cupriavidus sp. 2TAF22]|uniref:MBL fold metallo-hydrolase n=1 Tax=unclassified Cupriavidus TaxID=2640874 RepID=UPI003F8DDDAA